MRIEVIDNTRVNINYSVPSGESASTHKIITGMKHFPKLVLTFIISMITIFVIASSVEINRDAVGMYIVVFLFPALFVGFINMMALLFACEINSSKPFKIALITLPVIIGIGLIFFGEGQLKFVGIFAAISTAIVNSYYSWRILV